MGTLPDCGADFILLSGTCQTLTDPDNQCPGLMDTYCTTDQMFPAVQTCK